MQRSHTMILAAVALGAGALAFFLWQGKSPPVVPDNAPQAPEDQPFPMDRFFLAFDTNRSGDIVLEEFKEAYKRALSDTAQPFQFNKGPGQPPLGPEDAFNHLDVNDDRKIDRDDLSEAYDKAWVAYKQECANKGLEARLWRKKWVVFNPHQVQTVNRETGAEARKEVPWAGRFFDEKYFNGRRYVSVTAKDGAVVSGFAWEDRVNNRIHVVGEGARISVFDPAEVSFTEHANAPQVEYIDTVRKTSFEDPAANLKLARRCLELGLKAEAGMMFERVLIFEPDNQEALDALGLKKEGPMFVPKGG